MIRINYTTLSLKGKALAISVVLFIIEYNQLKEVRAWRKAMIR